MLIRQYINNNKYLNSGGIEMRPADKKDMIIAITIASALGLAIGIIVGHIIIGGML